MTDVEHKLYDELYHLVYNTIPIYDLNLVCFHLAPFPTLSSMGHLVRCKFQDAELLDPEEHASFSHF